MPVLEPKIVVSSQMGPGQTVLILLTRSIGALDANDNSNPEALLEQVAINDALVFIKGPIGQDTLSPLGSGLYGGVLTMMLPGLMYTLVVKSPSLGTVQATTTVQQQVRFADVDAGLYISGRDTLAQVNYSINDPKGKNWYVLNGQHLSSRNLTDRLLNPRITTTLVDDAGFEGQIKADQFKVFAREFEPGDTLAVFLASVPKDYYDYLKIRMDTRFGVADFIAEPINYPSNVEGGLGFFNLYLPDIRVFILE